MNFWSFATVAVIAGIIAFVFPETSRNMRLKLESDLARFCIGDGRRFQSFEHQALNDTAYVRWCLEAAKQSYEEEREDGAHGR